MNPHLIYPRPGDKATVYLKNVITNPAIQVGDFTMYHDFRNDPRAFQENNVLYHYPVNGDRLGDGEFCSIACGAVFLFTSANHALGSLSTYPFPIFFTEWGLDGSRVTEAWDNKGDIVLGNDVWVGYEAVILSGVTIGDGAIIGARALVTQDVPPYTIVGACLPAPPASGFPTRPSPPSRPWGGGTGRWKPSSGTSLPSRPGSLQTCWRLIDETGPVPLGGTGPVSSEVWGIIPGWSVCFLSGRGSCHRR